MSPVPDKAKDGLAVPFSNTTSDDEDFVHTDVDIGDEFEVMGDGTIEAPEDLPDDLMDDVAFSDPLADLVEKTKNNPGAPFDQEILTWLSALKGVDRGRFETLRAELKLAGCRVVELDKLVDAIPSGLAGEDKTQSALLSAMIADVDLFCGQDGTPYADVAVDSHRQTFAIRDGKLRNWLSVRLYREHAQVAGASALDAAISLFEARANFGNSRKNVGLRAAAHDGRLYLDLADDAWRSIEIDDLGWRVVTDPPIRFLRPPALQSIPAPMPGGNIDRLKWFLNVSSDRDFVLVVAWLLGVLKGTGPYPVLVLVGEQGSSKSTFARILRALVDPSKIPLRSSAGTGQDLFVAARNAHVIAFDNMSGVSSDLSDALCCLATGGGYAKRRLYTDQDEHFYDAIRPVILNGIEDIVTRADLADRCLFITLAQIPNDRRRTESEIWAEFERERRHILGALLDATSVGLRSLPSTALPQTPRMADFALWVTACESSFWEPGTFMSAYIGNQNEAAKGLIELDPVAHVIKEFISKQLLWEGTASQLVQVLTWEAEALDLGDRAIPKLPGHLSNLLKRVRPILERQGIEIQTKRVGHAGTKIIRISKASSDLDGQAIDLVRRTTGIASLNAFPHSRIRKPAAISVEQTPVQQAAGLKRVDDAPIDRIATSKIVAVDADDADDECGESSTAAGMSHQDTS